MATRHSAVAPQPRVASRAAGGAGGGGAGGVRLRRLALSYNPLGEAGVLRIAEGLRGAAACHARAHRGAPGAHRGAAARLWLLFAAEP